MTTNYRKICAILLLTLLAVLSSVTAAYAHGVVINYTIKTDGLVELSGEFDTGEAMAEAQVTIYSPEDPLNPWLAGTADKNGNYAFVIDPELLGTWDVQFRKAGHGDFIHFQLEAGMIDPALVTQPPGEVVGTTSAAQTQSNAATPGPSVPPVSAVSSGGNAASGGGFSSLQILLMSASVIWGFVGTALYFSSKKNQDNNHAHGHHH